MNLLLKRSLHVNKKLNNIKTVFRSITGAEQPKNEYRYNNNRSNNSQKIFYGIVGATTVTCIGLYNFFDENNKFKYLYTAYAKHEDIPAGIYDRGLPCYSYNEIISHTTAQKRIWVIYKEGVYDITDFIESHPGGKVILQAAGGSIEPFWTIYGVHESNEVYQMLESLRIGNVSKEDSEKLTKHVENPYITDPIRGEHLKPANVKPYNAETSPPSLLMDNFHTPNDIFYVRNHLPVPVVDIETYKLEIEIQGLSKTLSLSLADLKQYTKHDVVATIMCAGNRRSEMSEEREVKGLNWGHAVIGNAVWSGVYLRDILNDVGVTDESNYKHVQFEGLDTDPNLEGRFYGASVPFNYIMDKYGEVLLAYEMNGEPLPRDHGYPVRVIVPGVCGARNIKWLKKVIVSNEESQVFWQQNDYKSFNSSTMFDEADYSKAAAIQTLPVTSAICVPAHGETVTLSGGYVTVKGYAFSGGGSKILRVDVTADGGITWFSADLKSTDQLPPHHYGWTLWTVNVPIEKGKNEVELWAKALDSNHNTQPETFEHIWNIRGVLSNAYHRVKIHIK